jgi:hypothetical protein
VNLLAYTDGCSAGSSLCRNSDIALPLSATDPGPASASPSSSLGIGEEVSILLATAKQLATKTEATALQSTIKTWRESVKSTCFVGNGSNSDCVSAAPRAAVSAITVTLVVLLLAHLL